MGRRKREPMSEGKRNIIAGLLQEYDIKTAKDIEDIYGFEVSDGMVSDITDRLLPQIEEWQNRPLDEVYPIVFIDAVHFSVRDNGQIKKLAAYVIPAVNLTGHKEVLSIHIGENESAKYWLGVLNELKNRGVKDILVICADGLSEMKEAVAAAYNYSAVLFIR
jgi:transposase, mutator family|nr:MAG TPA: transposase [Caudoviricetes sp.]